MRDGEPVGADYDQHALIAQIARAVFNDFEPGFYFVVIVTGVILVLAANTAFNGFPVLGSILAKDGYAPRALGSRGDRLAYSNGIVFLAVMAIVLIVIFDAETTRLIQLYIVGVFVSFNLSQLGMIRHWTRHLATERDPAKRRRMVRSRVINAIGLTFTAVVLVVVLMTKFLAGAWITILAMAAFFAIMQRHPAGTTTRSSSSWRPTRTTRSSRPGCTRSCWSPSCTSRRCGRWRSRRRRAPTCSRVSTSRPTRPRPTGCSRSGTSATLGVPLKVLHSPYRELVKPIVDYATEIRRANPRGVVAVYIPEYVVGRWWEQLLHNQTALRLKGRLLFTPGRDGHLGALPAALLPDRPRA